MTTTDLLTRCAEAGITVVTDGGRLLVDAPATPTADALLAELAAAKTAILHALDASHNSHYSQNAPVPVYGEDVRDPRPDLAADTRLWRLLLVHAWLHDGDEPAGAYAALGGVRTCGARLRWQPNGGLRLVPGDDYAGDWAADRADWLAPHRDAVAGWLRLVADGERAAAVRTGGEVRR